METTQVDKIRCQSCRRTFAAQDLMEVRGDRNYEGPFIKVRLDCPNCGFTGSTGTWGWWAPVVIKATVSTKTRCDASCRTATSDKCKCSCGGADHGVGAGAAHTKMALGQKEQQS